MKWIAMPEHPAHKNGYYYCKVKGCKEVGGKLQIEWYDGNWYPNGRTPGNDQVLEWLDEAPSSVPVWPGDVMSALDELEKVLNMNIMFENLSLWASFVNLKKAISRVPAQGGEGEPTDEQLQEQWLINNADADRSDPSASGHIQGEENHPGWKSSAYWQQCYRDAMAEMQIRTDLRDAEISRLKSLPPPVEGKEDDENFMDSYNNLLDERDALKAELASLKSTPAGETFSRDQVTGFFKWVHSTISRNNTDWALSHINELLTEFTSYLTSPEYVNRKSHE